MKTCIFVVIKDEQEYLDDFIKYHLDLDIDHIFIFEDIMSISHVEITSKYDKVSLNSVKILNPKILNLVLKSTDDSIKY